MIKSKHAQPIELPEEEAFNARPAPLPPFQYRQTRKPREIKLGREVKWAVYPGYVRSRHDRDVHYVSGYELMALYGVREEECVVVLDDSMLSRIDIMRERPDVYRKARALQRLAANLPALRPRQDGNYTLPGSQK